MRHTLAVVHILVAVERLTRSDPVQLVRMQTEPELKHKPLMVDVEPRPGSGVASLRWPSSGVGGRGRFAVELNRGTEEQGRLRRWLGQWSRSGISECRPGCCTLLLHGLTLTAPEAVDSHASEQRECPPTRLLSPRVNHCC
jgi:hypothetical protein